MCISKTGLSSLKVDWANYEDEVPDALDSNQNIEIACRLIELKDLFMKSPEKLFRDECVCNTTILKL